MPKYKHFSQKDFSRCNPACDINQMDESFLSRVDTARETSGIPYVVNSAYRTVEHEKKNGRDGSSSHTKGLALDIKAVGSRQRYYILKGLLAVGFTRIGIGENFIHVDDDPEKERKVIWHYY